VRAGDYLPDIAVDHITGAIYVVWADGQGTNVNSVVLSKSTDGGQHWSTPVAIDQTPGPHAFNGTVEVAGDGTVAVLYYDFRNNTPAPGLPTDVWLTHSTDGGATWTEQHVTRPFDMKQAPVARGFCLGGTLSFLCGTQDLGLDGVIGFYAGMTRNMSGQGTLLDQAPRIGLPALGLFGGADQGIPPEQVAEFDRRLDGAGVEHEIISYPGAPHSFFDRRAAEFAEASADAWTRVLRFIRARAERAKER